MMWQWALFHNAVAFFVPLDSGSIQARVEMYRSFGTRKRSLHIDIHANKTIIYIDKDF